MLIQTNIKWQSGAKVILDGLWKRGLMLQMLTIGTGKIFNLSLCFIIFSLCLIKGRILLRSINFVHHLYYLL